MKRIRRRSSGPIRLPGLFFRIFNIYRSRFCQQNIDLIIHCCVMGGEVKVIDLNVFLSIHIKIADNKQMATTIPIKRFISILCIN